MLNLVYCVDELNYNLMYFNLVESMSYGAGSRPHTLVYSV